MADRTYEQVLEDIRTHPDNHRHDFDELQRCCYIAGAVDTRLMDAHGKFVNFGTNGGVRWDVHRGPCACGAWH